MNSNNKILIASAWPYANSDSLHLGHLFGNYLFADLSARSFRKLGYEVLFVSGSDDFGSGTLSESIKNNVNFLSMINNNNKFFKEQLIKADISLDLFGSTSSESHFKMVNKIASKLNIKKGEVKINFCKNCNMQLGNKLIILNITETCSICGNKILKVDCEGWFLNCNDDYFNDLVNNCKLNYCAQIEVKNIKFNNKLKLISRKTPFGVSIFETDYKFYVWFEALISYLTITNEREFTKRIYFMGKDNVVFHTFWLSNIFGRNYYPTDIFASFWLKYEDNKMSKSLKNGLFLKNLSKNQLSAIRMYLINDLSFSNDKNFDFFELKSFTKNIIIDKILNLFQRIIKLNFKNSFKLRIKINKSKLFDPEFIYFLNLNCEQKFNASWSIFVNKINRINYFFSKTKIWTNNNFEFEVALLEQVFNFLNILSPNLSNKINKYIIFKEDYAELFFLKDKIYDVQF